MSLCHIPLGAEDSNRRSGVFIGLPGFRRFALAPVSPVRSSSCFTFAGDAFRKKIRRRICEIRRTPCPGFSCFSVWIFSATTPGSALLVTPARSLGFSPSSPCARYCRTHSLIVPWVTPTSCATNKAGILSSRCNCTARRLTS